MARATTWAIRLTGADGRAQFLRVGGVIGKGPIATFYSKDKAEAAAAPAREAFAPMVVTVIERSHGRNF